jgi:CheY-like chemotaxis protein
MVIDDSLVIRKIVETCLHRAGYEVESFADGVEALCWLNKMEARVPDLIIVDLSLPRLDGYEVIRLLKARPALENTVLVILPLCMAPPNQFPRSGWPYSSRAKGKISQEREE